MLIPSGARVPPRLLPLIVPVTVRFPPTVISVLIATVGEFSVIVVCTPELITGEPVPSVSKDDAVTIPAASM